jgi:16S rRNA (adenine1518-N6/adenine1519-N6)-dimethyltransferase
MKQQKVKLIKDKNNSYFAKKSLGQNFLNDFLVVKDICKAANIENKIVLEVGPGTGFLTRGIINHKPKKLILIEKDRRLMLTLQKNFGELAEIINADALKLDVSEISKAEKQKITIISNLPYNIGTTLVLNWLNDIDHIEDIVVMLQKEVVDRICASPRTKDYGRISILIQSICDVKKLFDVKPECFNPKPKVMSSIVKITPKHSNKIDKYTFRTLDKICKIAFSQRRKKLSNVFKNTDFYKILNEDIINKRAEELSVEEYIQLSNVYDK